MLVMLLTVIIELLYAITICIRFGDSNESKDHWPSADHHGLSVYHCLLHTVSYVWDVICESNDLNNFRKFH